MMDSEQEIWDFLHRHLHSIFTHDVETYRATTGDDLSLYEWFVAPHRMDGLEFHFFMLEHSWAGIEGDFRFDLLEPRLQHYGETAIVSYTFMLSVAGPEGIRQSTHNESRVLVRRDGEWRVVHVHKSPGWRAPREAPADAGH
jgi:ketosteroid isomerase-like protein